MSLLEFMKNKMKCMRENFRLEMLYDSLYRKTITYIEKYRKTHGYISELDTKELRHRVKVYLKSYLDDYQPVLKEIEDIESLLKILILYYFHLRMKYGDIDD